MAKTRARLSNGGDPCPTCHQPTQIREHATVTHKQLKKPFYYSRWFFCTNKECKTTMIMPSQFKVMNERRKSVEKLVAKVIDRWEDTKKRYDYEFDTLIMRYNQEEIELSDLKEYLSRRDEALREAYR